MPAKKPTFQKRVEKPCGFSIGNLFPSGCNCILYQHAANFILVSDMARKSPLAASLATQSKTSSVGDKTLASASVTFIQKNSRRLELSISKNTPHGRWGQGLGRVDPRFLAGLPFPVPEVLEFVAFRRPGKIFQQFSRDFPGVFPENPRTDPGNSHSLLEFSDSCCFLRRLAGIYPPWCTEHCLQVGGGSERFFINSVQTGCIAKGEAQKSLLFWRFSGGF